MGPFERQVQRLVLQESSLPLPDGFLSGSKYKDTVYLGRERKIDLGFSLKPDGGHEYGIYVTPILKYAMLYGSHVYRAWVNFKRPLVVADKSEISPRDLTRGDIQRLKSQGYDAIISIGPSGDWSKASEFVLFDTDQVFVEKTSVGG